MPWTPPAGVGDDVAGETDAVGVGVGVGVGGVQAVERLPT
jgi:hypothetical protein